MIHLSKKNYRRPVFNTIWVIYILKVCLEEQVLGKYYEIKHLILLKILNMIDIIEASL